MSGKRSRRFRHRRRNAIEALRLQWRAIGRPFFRPVAPEVAGSRPASAPQ